MTSACKYRVHKQWFWLVVSNFSENDHRKTRCFQHRGVKTRGVLTTWFLVFSTLPAIFNTFLYCIPVRFFHWIPAFLQPLFSLKPYCVPAPNTHKAEGFGLICTHILTWFQHGACPEKPVFQHCLRHFHQILHPKKTHTDCIPALLTCSSTACVRASC